MIRDIREAFYETLMDLDWMDRVTKDTAMDKVSNLCATISLLGHPRHCYMYVQDCKRGSKNYKISMVYLSYLLQQSNIKDDQIAILFSVCYMNTLKRQFL